MCNLKSILITPFLLFNIILFGQNNVLTWSQDCIVKGTFDTTKTSLIQIKNCQHISSGIFWMIPAANNPRTPEDLTKINFDSLDLQYQRKKTEIESMDLPNSEYWTEIRNYNILRLTQNYNFYKIALKAYLDPKALTEIKNSQNCIYFQALMGGKKKILENWKIFTSEIYKESENFDAQYTRNSKKKNNIVYAKIFLTTLALYKCDIITYPLIELNSTSNSYEEIKKLFSKIEIICD